jgi:hypothetical protein
MLVGGATVAGLAGAGAWRYLAHRRTPQPVEGASVKAVNAAVPTPVISPIGQPAGHWSGAGAGPPRNDGPGFGRGVALVAVHEPPTNGQGPITAQ